MVTGNIKSYARNYFLPHITVSYATGQWFETAMWEKYHAEMPEHADPLVRVRLDRHPDVPMLVDLWTTGRGSTWHEWDNDMFLWIGQKPQLARQYAAVAFVLLCGLVFCSFRAARYLLRRHLQGRKAAATQTSDGAEAEKAD